jgi:hypothetical protein
LYTKNGSRKGELLSACGKRQYYVQLEISSISKLFLSHLQFNSWGCLCITHTHTTCIVNGCGREPCFVHRLEACCMRYHVNPNIWRHPIFSIEKSIK